MRAARIPSSHPAARLALALVGRRLRNFTAQFSGIPVHTWLQKCYQIKIVALACSRDMF